MKILFLLIFSLLQISYAQVIPEFFVGNLQESSALKWKSIENDKFKVIYPDGLKKDALRVMNTLNTTYKHTQKDLKIDAAKISIILRVGPVQSNGFVTLAPRRSEWFLTPYLDTGLGAGQWSDLLAIHEYRHVAQMDAFFQGFGEALYYFMGEFGRGLSMVWSAPAWYMEGDAVYVETALTHYGRGRLPEFESKMKALFMEEQAFSFRKMILQSYETYIPNHYILGFYLVAYLREVYGEDVIYKIVNDAALSAYNPFSFYNAIEEHTKKEADTVYSDMREYFLKKWKVALNASPSNERDELLERSGSFNSYQFVWAYKDGQVAYKSGFHSPGEIVFIKDKEETHLKTTGQITSSGIKKCADMLVWSELAPHHRWGNMSYSELVTYDLKHNERSKITSSTRFFSPNFSVDCSKIIAIEIDKTMKKSLVLVNPKDGRVLQKISIPLNSLYTHIDMLNNDEIIAIKKDERDGRVSLVRFSFTLQKETNLIEPDYHVIGNPEINEGQVYFRWSYNGVDNIYSYHLSTKKITQLTSSPFGAYTPSVEDGYLYYSEYHSNGYRPVKSKLRSFQKNPKENEHSIDLSQNIKKRNADFNFSELSQKENENFEANEYGAWSNSLKPHSWFVLPTPRSINLSVVSSNLMQDLFLTAGYSYSNIERTGGAFAGLSFARYYPIFDFSIYDKRRGRQTPGTDEEDEIKQNWHEIEMETGVLFLINHSSGAYNRFFSFRPFYGLSKLADRPYTVPNELNDQTLHYFGGAFEWSVGKRTSFLDFNPRWGFKTNVVGKTGRAASNNSFGADLFSSETYLFFPGILNHHSLYFSGSFSYQRDLNYIFSPEFTFARGYDNFYFDHISKYTANYTFPVLNADWAWGDYVYFRRFGLNLFYDVVQAQLDSGFETEFKSFGAELLINSSFFMNLYLTIDWGVRYSHKQLDSSDEVEFFLSSVF